MSSQVLGCGRSRGWRERGSWSISSSIQLPEEALINIEHKILLVLLVVVLLLPNGERHELVGAFIGHKKFITCCCCCCKGSWGSVPRPRRHSSHNIFRRGWWVLQYISFFPFFFLDAFLLADLSNRIQESSLTPCKKLLQKECKNFPLCDLSMSLSSALPILLPLIGKTHVSWWWWWWWCVCDDPFLQPNSSNRKMMLCKSKKWS